MLNCRPLYPAILAFIKRNIVRHYSLLFGIIRIKNVLLFIFCGVTLPLPLSAIMSISESINLMTESINDNINEMNNISANADALSELSVSQENQLKFFSL